MAFEEGIDLHLNKREAEILLAAIQLIIANPQVTDKGVIVTLNAEAYEILRDIISPYPVPVTEIKWQKPPKQN